MNFTLGEDFTLSTQTIESNSPYDLESSSYGDISVESLYAMGDPQPEKKVLPSLLKPLLIAGAGILAYLSFK